MPSLHIFGRRWAFASDDLVFPATTEAILRLTWFVIAFCLYTIPGPQQRRPCVEVLGDYILILMILNALLITVCFAIAFVSARGTIFNAYPRRHLSMLLYFRCPLFLCEVGINIFGTVAVATPGQPGTCSGRMIGSVWATVALEWAVIFIFLVGLYLVFDPFDHGVHNNHSLARDNAKMVWKRRLRFFFLCANADDNAKTAFEEVAELMTDFFGDLDLVATDVWAGLLLLANKDMSVMADTEPMPPTAIDECERPAWMNVPYASRMMQFALAVYGWPHYIWGGCGVDSLLALCRRLRCCRCDDVLIVRDNCCRCNTAAFLQTTKLAETDIHYASFHNQIYEVPFVACADVSTETIVVSIRGSMSLRDAITDLTARDEPLPLHSHHAPVVDEPGAVPSPVVSDVRVHSGMLQSAKYVCAVLDKQNIVDDLFVLYPSYSLVLTGHSLGAGVAVLVGLLLRHKYPGVRVFAFGPPGCVVNADGLRLCNEFVFSIVLGDDLVPRMSYESMQRLKYDMIELLEQCDKPKYLILINGCFRLLCSQRRDADANERIDNTAADLEAPPPDPPARVVVSSDSDAPPVRQAHRRPLLASSLNRRSGYGTSTDELNSEPDETERRVHLYCPGQVLHLCAPPHALNQHTQLMWTDYRRFTNLKISNRMVSEHVPAALCNRLQQMHTQLNSEYTI